MSQQGPRQRRKALQDARRELDAELSREKGDYVPPDRSLCDQKEWLQPVDESDSLRVAFWIWRYEGRLVDFVIRIEEGDWNAPDDWREISRIDCKGGRCHIHPPDDIEAHQLIHRLDDIEDVEKAYARANGVATSVAVMIRGRRS